ncbi:MAG: hypothetical protein R3C17_10665 [Planctomycetaceae bacterium]
MAKKAEAENPSPYMAAQNKSQLGVICWEQNPDSSAKEIVEIAAKFRPDITGFTLGDANNSKVKWKKDNGIVSVPVVKRSAAAKKAPETDSLSALTLIENLAQSQVQYNCCNDCRQSSNTIFVIVLIDKLNR